MENKKLFLLDAYALIYRAYYALITSPRVTSKGLNTSAIFGFCNTIDEILRKENPSHIAVCFDPSGGKTFRHAMYPEYKANREKQPEDITLSVPYIQDIIRAYNIPVIEIAGYEADDIIGTLARRAESEGFTTYMMTPDKDYGQLVTDKIFMYRPSVRGKGFEIRGVKEVCERYGLENTQQVIDMLALEGDASDNIPGCPGVGEKTAVKLIRQFGSVENMLAHTSEIKGVLGLKVADNADQIRFSKELVTIKTDVPVDITIDQMKRKPEDLNRLREIFTELEFKTFIARLGGAAEVAPVAAPKESAAQPSLFDDVAPVGNSTAAPTQSLMGSLFDIPTANAVADVTIKPSEEVADLNRAIEILRRAASLQYVGFAANAYGDEAMTAELKGFAIALSDEESYYFTLPVAERAQWLEALQQLMTSGATIVSHDVKRDYIVLKNNGVAFASNYFDTSVAHYLLHPEMRHRLSDVALAYIGVDIDTEPVGRKNDPQADVNASQRTGRQAAVVFALREALSKALEQNGLTSLFTDIETPFVRVLAEMEWEGVRIDTSELALLSSQLTERLRGLESRCYELAGHQFNIASPRQVGDVLFDELKIDSKAKRTKTGAYSTTEEILEKYRNSHEIVGLILKIRGLNKLLTTYINSLPNLINPKTGKIHTTYNQTVTATGRISSTNPNLQNIPVRTDDGREIRRAFIPDAGDIFLSADYSQIELRLMADMSGDPDMIEAFAEGSDIHRSTAAKIYKVALDEVTDAQRRNAKTANFGIIYGISAFGLSERLGIPRAEAKMLIEGYFATYPHIREYIDNVINKARTDGYVTTIMGRKRYLPDITSRNAVVRQYAERNAVNAPIQGSAADVIKIAMIRIFKEMERRGMASKMIMQVHDELIFNVKPAEQIELQELIVKEMVGAYTGRVRLEVAYGTGSNWLQAH